MGLSPNLEIEAANTGENQMLDRWAMECIMFLPKPTFAGSPVLFYPLSDLFIGAMIQADVFGEDCQIFADSIFARDFVR